MSRADLEGFVRARAEESAEAGNTYTEEDFSGMTLAEAFRRVTFRT
jgi:hypothetical protein